MHNYKRVKVFSFHFCSKVTLVKYCNPLGTTVPESDAYNCFMLSDVCYLA